MHSYLISYNIFELTNGKRDRKREREIKERQKERVLLRRENR